MNMRAHSLRLSPTAKAKAFLPSSLLLHMRRRSFKRAGKAEGKIVHPLSPQRHMSAVGRGRNEREREQARWKRPRNECVLLFAAGDPLERPIGCRGRGGA
jgi:hypothetical protein